MPMRQEISHIYILRIRVATDSYINLMFSFFIYAVPSFFPLLRCFNFGRDSSNLDLLH